MKRLKADIWDGSSAPAGFIVPNYENTFVNNNITKIKYGPDIDRTYKIFEEPYENTEMMLTASESEMEELKNMSDEKWIKAFVQALKNEETNNINNKLNKKAEINVKDLPKIIWNEEEYRVLFNKNGNAEILNNFGNHVLTLKNTYTIKQVNEQLADREIVPEDYRQDNIVIENYTQNQRINRPEDTLYKDTHNIVSNKEYNGTMENMGAHYNMPHYGVDPDYLNDDFIDIELEDGDIKQFQNGICPYCQQGNIQVINDKDILWVFICNECGTEYTVDPESGDIKIKTIKADFHRQAENIITQNIELANKNLFLEEMNKHNYDTSMVDNLITDINFDGKTYEVNIILKDNIITDIICYLDNEVVDIPQPIYNQVMQDIEECNIQ